MSVVRVSNGVYKSEDTDIGANRLSIVRNVQYKASGHTYTYIYVHVHTYILHACENSHIQRAQPKEATVGMESCAVVLVMISKIENGIKFNRNHMHYV
jgi:hypothetical protein